MKSSGVGVARGSRISPRPRSYASSIMPWLQSTLLFIATINFLPQEVCCTKLSNVYWNSSNPIFRIDNTDHIIDVNKGNTPFEYDQVNIICPVYSRDISEDEAEKYIIYIVSKEEYDTCRITDPAPRAIAVCDKPYKLMYFTITFRSFTPQPGGLEFKPGHDYYFISTSSKSDLHKRIGGHCSTYHMKVVFKVCCDPASQPAHDQANSHIPYNGISTPRGTTTTTSTAKSTNTFPKITYTTTTSISPGTTNLKDTSHKSHTTKTSTKKVDTRLPDDRSQNEVMKSKLGGVNGSSEVHGGSIFIRTIALVAVTFTLFYTNTFLN